MKKLLIASIISILACSANAASFQSESATTPIQTEVVAMLTETPAAKAKGPKVITVGDRVIIIYKDGTTIVVDKDGSQTVIPARP